MVWKSEMEVRIACEREMEIEIVGGEFETACRHKAKDITPSITWRREAWKEDVLDDLP